MARAITSVEIIDIFEKFGITIKISGFGFTAPDYPAAHCHYNDLKSKPAYIIDD